MHIPTWEFIDLYMRFPTYGVMNEDVCCPFEGTDVIGTLIGRNVSWLLVGHDHKNDFGGTYEHKNSTIELMYGRKSGFGG